MGPLNFSSVLDKKNLAGPNAQNDIPIWLMANFVDELLLITLTLLLTGNYYNYYTNTGD